MGQYVPVPGTMVRVLPPEIEPECCFVTNNSIGALLFDNSYKTGDNIWVGQYVDLFNSVAGQVSNEYPSIGMFFGLINNT
jgi:hypothetical protein